MSLHTHTAKVLLVDDHPLVLESIRQLLEPHFTIVGMVQDSGEIISRALEQRPDVILLDACMPGLSGFAATKQLKKLLPSVKVILVTMLTEAISISEAFRAGASGYVLKQSASDELHAAIESVLANKRFLSKKIDAEVREAVEHEWFRPEGYSSDLTGRQREILVLLRGGERPVTELAEELGMTQPGASKHLRVLREVGLVRDRKAGKQRLYGLDARGLRPVHEWTGGFEQFWNESFDRLDAYVQDLKQARQEE